MAIVKQVIAGGKSGKSFLPISGTFTVTKSINYDDQIRKLYIKQDCLKKATRYLETDEATKLNGLIEKWKDISQMASNYLFTIHKNNVDKVGGLKQFNKIKKQQQKASLDPSIIGNYEDFIQSEAFDELSKQEKQDLNSRFHNLVASSDSDSDWSEEVTMEDLYDRLQLDYSLVYEE